MNIHNSYTPADNSLTGFASNVTGATWTLTTTALTDGLAHQVTIHNDAATDHSAKTALLTGTDADGNSITETMNLPAGTATTTSTKYFKTLTSIVPSATIGADTMDIGYNDVAVSKSIILDYEQTYFNTGFSVGVTGTINYSIQATMSNPSTAGISNSGLWISHGTVAAKTAAAEGSYLYPIVAIRLLTNSLTAGATVNFNVLQGLHR